MHIKEITDKLNQIANNSVSIKYLQSKRAEINGWKKPRTNKIFSNSTVSYKDKDNIYAFHDGGRSEIQFNIGVEYLDGEELFRYGLAFSLVPSQYQPDPVNFITPKIKAFNECFNNRSSLFSNLLLWHYKEQSLNSRSKDFVVSTIPDKWIVWDNFIFIGKYFKKSLGKIDDNDLDEIISLFDKLMPIYEYVETNFKNHKLNISGERISRICWNNNGWVKPSGRKGKSTDQNTHEGKFGYGHEEWIADISKLIDGYHYCFLESIREKQEIFAGNYYNVDLFTINALNRNRYLIGKINNLQVIDTLTSENIKEQYLKNGWLAEMQDQIIAVGANNGGFSEWKGLQMFNIRFKPEDLQFYSDHILINDDSLKAIKRYNFVHKKNEIKLSIPLNKPFVFIPDKINESFQAAIKTKIYQRNARPIEISFLHDKIKNNLKKHLIEKFGNSISEECPTGQGTLIDIARKEDNKIIFYEIKTYYNIKSCIREAIGQLLEYAFWPDSENAEEFIIVSQNKPNIECKTYLKKLRKKYNIPIYYQQFNLDTNQLSEKH